MNAMDGTDKELEPIATITQETLRCVLHTATHMEARLTTGEKTPKSKVAPPLPQPKAEEPAWPHTKAEQEPISVKSSLPKELVVTTDKASGKFFSGEFSETAKKILAMERRGSKKHIDTIISINYDKLAETVHLNGKELVLTPYDQIVHDAVVSHAAIGEQYVTIGSIYRTMTGAPDKINITQSQADAIKNSLLKARHSWVTIDATKEAQAYGFDKYKYEGALIPHETITAVINGNETECIHLLRTPPLYDYANRKNQIARMETRLLNTPVNKNEDALLIQAYLYRRILAMIGSPKLSRNIVYDSLYKEIILTTNSKAALWNKKSKIRDTTKTILGFWKEKGFIARYEEQKRGTVFYSLSIQIPASKETIDMQRKRKKGISIHIK
jgi:hypothetical protein